jgi:hypothetical protein
VQNFGSMAALTIVLSMLLMTVVLVVGILLKVSTSPPPNPPPPFCLPPLPPCSVLATCAKDSSSWLAPPAVCAPSP